jgi:hypothetical protein
VPESDRATLPSPVIYLGKLLPLHLQQFRIAMPPRGANAKKESGRVKKAENEAKKKDAVATDKAWLPRVIVQLLLRHRY